MPRWLCRRYSEQRAIFYSGETKSIPNPLWFISDQMLIFLDAQYGNIKLTLTGREGKSSVIYFEMSFSHILLVQGCILGT